MLSSVEVNMTIICACVPSLKPLAARASPFLLGNAKEVSRKEEGESKEPSQARSRGEDMAGEMMEIITSHPEAETITTEARDPYAHDVPFINVLNMRPASMLRLNNRESLVPNMLITTLFCLWGFSYGLLNVLNIRFGEVVKLTEWKSDGLHAAYFGGYLIGPFVVGRYTLKRLGFAATFITGLYIYACGTLLFWPSAVLGSVPTFIVSNVVTGAGLGLLETTANSFISMCGPLEYSEIRLCVAQGIQGIGTTAALGLAEKVIFKYTNDVTQVVKAQWTYLGIAFFDVLLSVIFYYLPIPEAPDEDLKELANRRPERKAIVLGLPVFGVTLGLGVWSLFFYVAGQEVHIVGFDDYVTSSRPR
jgi:fucose permease